MSGGPAPWVATGAPLQSSEWACALASIGIGSRAMIVAR